MATILRIVRLYDSINVSSAPSEWCQTMRVRTFSSPLSLFQLALLTARRHRFVKPVFNAKSISECFS